MKKIAIALGTLAVAATAYASHWGEYDAKALDLANKLLLCPLEVASIGSQPYTRTVAAGFVGGETPTGGISTTYTIRFVQKLPAPSFTATEYILKIRESKEPSGITAPDAPGIVTKVKCSVEKTSID